MSKRKKRQNKPAALVSKQAITKKPQTWRRFGRSAIVSIILLSVTGIGIAAYKRNYDIAHDLSVIGQGQPVVVQIHDPGCQLCQRLRSNASDAIAPMKDQILFRIADITTPEGKRLQRRHKVPHVTLLLFDRNGEVRNVLTGVKDEETLHRAFEVHLKRHENSKKKPLLPQNSNS